MTARKTRSFVRSGIAFDAGVLFKIAETVHVASPTRSATVRRLATAVLSDTLPPHPVDSGFSNLLTWRSSYLKTKSTAQRETHSWENQTAKVWNAFCDVAELGIATLRQSGQIVQLKKSIAKISVARVGEGVIDELLFSYHLAAPAGFLAGRDRIAPGDLFVPCAMECPGPGFAEGAASHRLKSPGLADCAEINGNKNSAEHNHGGDMVQHVTDRDWPAPERACAFP